MKEQLAVQKILLAKYEELRAKNPRFSRRSFSRRLGVSPGAVSEIFNGRRQVSMKFAERVAMRLALDPQERAELFALFPKNPSRKLQGLAADDSVPENYLQLSADQFRVIGDWYHFAILTLMRTRGFRSDPAWISNRLGLSLNVTKTALERLKRLGLIMEDEKGRLTRTKTRYRTTDDVADVSVRRAHTQYLELAREALDQLPVDKRDFTSLMLTISPEQLTRAKELIRKFQDDFAAELEAGPRTEVYQLLIQLFPLTKTEGEKP